jgi:hypothetical protein
MLDQAKADNLKALLAACLAEMSDRVPIPDATDVEDYIDYGEYGVAWELLLHFVGDSPPSEFITAGQLMGFDTAALGKA